MIKTTIINIINKYKMRTINIILIVLVIFVMFFIIDNFYRHHKSAMQKSSSLIGGNHETTQSTKMIIPKRFPQVGVLTNDVIHTIPIEHFVWLEKTDGEHVNIIIHNSKAYTLDKEHQPVQLPMSIKTETNKQSIIDTELYKGKYYVFDAPMINGQDISELSYPVRMNRVEQFLKSNPSLLKSFILKSYTQCDKNELIKLIDNVKTINKSPTTKNKIDGYILQHKSLPYYSREYIVYKLKRRNLNTVDFKLHYVPEEFAFYLYLYGTYNDCFFNRKRLPRDNPYYMQHEGIDANKKLPPSLYVLFASSFFEDLHIYVPDLDYDKTDYFPDEIKQIDALTTQIDKAPEKFENAIIEFSLTNSNQWVPLKIRNDKPNANGYHVGLSNCATMFNPITRETINDDSLYFTKSKQLAFNNAVINPYHEINKVIRQFIVEHTINKIMTPHLRGRLSVLDLAGGRGGDLLNLYNSGASNIFAVDADKTALVQYVERTPKTTNKTYVPLDKKSFNKPPNLSKMININAVYGFLSENNSKIIEEIKSRYEYPKLGFDVVLMNYAYHYLCDESKNKLNELHKTVTAILRKGGLFIFTYFDGDKLIKHDEVTKGPFTIKINKSTKTALMPLPTIDASGYREEPLVLKEHLEVFTKSKSFKLVEKFQPLKLVTKYIASITDTEKVSEFIDLINVIVLEHI